MEGAPNPVSSASSVASGGSGRSNGADLRLGMFGHGVGDLGGGASAFGGSLMNGYGLGGDAEPAAASSSFDLSDFPSLEGGGASNQNGLAAALRQQQLMAQQQQRQMLQGGTSTAGGTSDGAWPALPGVPPQSGRTNGTNSPFLLRTNDDKSPRSSSNGPFYTGANGPNDVDNAVDGTGLLQHQQRSSTPSSTAAGASSASAGGSTLSRDYGLLGLLSLIRMPDSDRKALALGTDLTLFGQLENSSSKEPNYQVNTLLLSRYTKRFYRCSLFVTIFRTSRVLCHSLCRCLFEIIKLPICYYMQAPTLKTGHLTKFQLETLFYIFYSLPKDALQAHAAQELYERGWRYHVDLELWFKEITPADGVQVAATSGPQYMYFDMNSWERRLCSASMMSKNITGGFLPEEETRVKYPNS